jgi:hypothetical protein
MTLKSLQNRKILIIPVVLLVVYLVVATLITKRSPIESLDVHEHVEYNLSEEWASQLPLKNPHYYVDYDYGTGHIKATIYTYPSFSLTTDMEVDMIKKEVTDQLTQLGTDLNKIPIDWTVK